MYSVDDPPKASRRERDEARIFEHADWIKPAVERRATYARVKDPIELRGMWRLDGTRTLHLTDAYISIERVIRPHENAIYSKHSTKILSFLNPENQVKKFEVRSDQYTNDELADKLDGFASYPGEDKHKRYFAEMIRILSRQPGTAIQDQVDSLGWNTAADGSLVWTLGNGTETLQGFIPSEQAPCVAPAIPSPNNGYFGAVTSLKDGYSYDNDFWRYLICDYAPHVECQSIILALISFSALIQLPPGIAPDGAGLLDGTLQCSPDLYGPSRHGKSRTINAVLSLFGTRFLWNTSPILAAVSGGDTRLGRNSAMAMMRYQLFVDRDHKDEPGMDGFSADHKMRAETIIGYVDDAGSGGIRQKRTGGTERRAAPAGCNIRTMNYDHAVYSIQQGDDRTENRACTFVWPDGIKGDDAVSVLMDQTRMQGYATGQAYRRWLMQWMNWPEVFKTWIDRQYDLACGATDGYEWHSDYHRNHARLLILGSLIFHQFLKDCYPFSWFAGWIDSHIMTLVENRSARSLYIRDLIGKQKEESNVASFTLETLRAMLASNQLYIRDQQNNMLTEVELSEMPFSLSDLGYRPQNRGSDGEIWQPGQRCIGFLRHNGQEILVKTSDLLNALRPSADKRGIKLGSASTFLAALGEIIAPGRRGPLQSVKIAHKTGWYMCIPTAILFGDQADEDADEMMEESPMASASRPIEDCSCGVRLWVATTQARRFVWKCAACDSVYIPSGTQTHQQPAGGDFDMPLDQVEEG